jgi:hypothetical protein
VTTRAPLPAAAAATRLTQHLQEVGDQTGELTRDLGDLRDRTYGPLAGVVEILNLHQGALDKSEASLEALQKTLRASEKAL